MTPPSCTARRGRAGPSRDGLVAVGGWWGTEAVALANLRRVDAPDVELLWWAGCPSTERALAEVREALAEFGFDGAAVRMSEIQTDAQAASARFAGSPTILLNGADVVPAGRDTEIGLSCRVYRRRDGRVSPTPDPDDLRDALRRASAPTEVNRR
jgi:hypothetical protein